MNYRKRNYYLLFTIVISMAIFLGERQLSSFNSNNLSHEISKKNLQEQVTYLSSDALEGRLTGSQGEKLATQYIATIFQQLGLEPAGDKGTYFQEFNFTAGVALGKKNTLSITNQKNITKQLILNEDWRPLSFSDNASFIATELIFVGYGITAPAVGNFSAYDSYHGLHVRNKWVVVFKDIPDNMSAEQRQQLNQYSSLRYKAFTAKEHGAKGIIFVEASNAKSEDKLIPLSYDTSLSGSGIVALSVKKSVIDSLLKKSSHSDFLTNIKMSGHTNIEKKIQRGRNVLAKLKCSANSTAPIIIVGAHVDHLGHGKLSGSRANENEIGMIHPGADDNASGIASILAVAAKLSDLKEQHKLFGNKDILFAAWSGEEFGILGSTHFVKNYKKPITNSSLHSTIEAAINLDMVGHLRKRLVLQGTGSSLAWPKLLNSIHSPMQVIMQSDPYLPTDSTAFYLSGIPTLNFFTGAHDNYHTPRDKSETLNYEGLKTISIFLSDLILALENDHDSIDYQAVQKTTVKVERNFKIYLGTIPDYTSSDVSGVRISGVANHSPAERAGIKQDDVIIALAGKKIHDIYDYTFALNALQVGKPVNVNVMRGHKKVPLIIVAQYRN